MSERYFVSVDGCDDVTSIVLDLSADEVATLEKVRDAINAASDYTCMPEMRVRPATQQDEDES